MKKFSIYQIFHGKRESLEDIQKEDQSPTLKRFFKLFGRYFWKLVSLNLLMLLSVIPLLAVFFLYFGMAKTPSLNYPVFPQLYGASLIQASAEGTFLLDLFGAQYLIPAYHNTESYVAIGIFVAFAVITFGWQNVGSTYVLRSLVRGEPGFLLADYFHGIKRNFWQGLLLGLLDAAILFFLGFNITYYWGILGSYGNDFMFVANVALLIVYFFMRFYLYHLLITFELSTVKILKNALIFVPLGIKRNLMAALGMLVLTCIVGFIMVVIVSFFGVAMLPVPLMITLFFYFSAMGFISSYAAYPIIDRYMIAPFVKSEENEEA